MERRPLVGNGSLADAGSAARGMTAAKTILLHVCPSLGLGLVDAVVQAGLQTFGKLSVRLCADGADALRASSQPFIYVGPSSLIQSGVTCKRLCLYALDAYEFARVNDVMDNVAYRDAILTSEVGYKDRAAEILNFVSSNPSEIWFSDSFETMVALAEKRRLRFISSDWKVKELLRGESIRKIKLNEPLPGAAVYFVSNFDDALTRELRIAMVELMAQHVSATKDD